MDIRLKSDLAYLVVNLFGTTLNDLVSKDLLEYENGSYHLSPEGLSMVTMYLVNLFESNFTVSQNLIC